MYCPSFLLLLLVISQGNCYPECDDCLPLPSFPLGRILFFYPFTSRSVALMLKPLAETLADRGHNVTMLISQDIEHVGSKNLRIIKNSEDYNFTDKAVATVQRAFEMTDAISVVSNSEAILNWVHIGWEATDIGLGNPKFREIMDNEGFDIVIFCPSLGGEVGYHIAHRTQASAVLFLYYQNIVTPNIAWSLGMPHNPSYLLNLLTNYDNPMSLWQRGVNFVIYSLSVIERELSSFPAMEKLIAKHFPEDDRISLSLLEQNTSLAFLAGHPFMMDNLRPMTANVKYVGLINCHPPKKLPEELEKFMNHSDGVIYFSFGTVFEAKTMKRETINIFVNTFGKLNQRVIWKLEADVPNMPDNVFTSKWLPQKDILGHPNLKLFITHAGLNSIQEAICHKKQILAIPLQTDQPGDALEAQRRGFGRVLNLIDLTEETLHQKISSMFSTQKYSKAAEEYGSLIQDNINSPMYTAVWWLEYLLRHAGKNHFKPPVHDLTWYQYFLLDVLAFLALALFVGAIAFIYLRGYIKSYLRKPISNDGKKSKGNKDH